MGRKTTIKKDAGFGYLTVLEVLPGRGAGTHSRVRCQCICGKETTVQSNLLKSKIKSCGCMQNVRVGPSPLKNRSKFPPGIAVKRAEFHKYKISARRRNLVFSLTFEEFKLVVEQNCHYCGQSPPFRTANHASGFVNGVDRKDPHIGYTTDNSVPCCTICNFSKYTQNYDQFKVWIRKVYNNLFNQAG